MQTNKDWEARRDALCKPEHFIVGIIPSESLTYSLTSAEYARLIEKLELVKDFARQLAVGMLKGTIKYPSDDWSVDTWIAMEMDDTVDSINYRLLRAEAQQQIEEYASRGRNALC